MSKKVYAVPETLFPPIRPSISKQLVILQHCPFFKWLIWENCIWESFLYCVFAKLFFLCWFPPWFHSFHKLSRFRNLPILSAAAAQQTAHCWMKLFTVHWTHLLFILIQLKVLFCSLSFPIHQLSWSCSRTSLPFSEKPIGFRIGLRPIALEIGRASWKERV